MLNRSLASAFWLAAREGSLVYDPRAGLLHECSLSAGSLVAVIQAQLPMPITQIEIWASDETGHWLLGHQKSSTEQPALTMGRHLMP